MDGSNHTKSRLEQNRSDQGERFVPLEAPAPMTHQKLATARDQDVDVDDGQERVYAVAHLDGVVQRPADEYEVEARSVLYATEDGEQVCERWYLGADADGFDAIDRMDVVAGDDLEPIGERARRYSPIVQKHPEVGQ